MLCAKEEVKVEITRGLSYSAFFFYVFEETISIYEVHWCGEGQRMFSCYEDRTLDRKE